MLGPQACVCWPVLMHSAQCHCHNNGEAKASHRSQVSASSLCPASAAGPAARQDGEGKAGAGCSESRNATWIPAVPHTAAQHMMPRHQRASIGCLPTCAAARARRLSQNACSHSATIPSAALLRCRWWAKGLAVRGRQEQMFADSSWCSSDSSAASRCSAGKTECDQELLGRP